MRQPKVQVWCAHPPALSGGRVYGGTVTRLKIGHRDVKPDTPLPAGVGLDDIVWVRPNAPKPPQNRRTVRKVTGSGGKVYTIVIDERGKSECSCPGFTFRRFCKHVGAV